jgi:hypothetical protein
MLVAWYGKEMEGRRTGMLTLFIRGGYEERYQEAIRICTEKQLVVDQVYFGAGSRDPSFNKIKTLMMMPMPKVVTIEVTAEVARHMPRMAGVHIMICVETDFLPDDVSLKVRTKHEQYVSTQTQYVVFPDESGPYEEDIQILYA